MTEPSNDNEEYPTPAYRRVITRMTDGLDNAACIAVMIGFDREAFLEAAGMAFDFIDKWRDTVKEGSDGEA